MTQPRNDMRRSPAPIGPAPLARYAWSTASNGAPVAAPRAHAPAMAMPAMLSTGCTTFLKPAGAELPRRCPPTVAESMKPEAGVTGPTPGIPAAAMAKDAAAAAPQATQWARPNAGLGLEGAEGRVEVRVRERMAMAACAVTRSERTMPTTRMTRMRPIWSRGTADTAMGTTTRAGT